MKYLIGFIAGVLLTSIGFTTYLKKKVGNSVATLPIETVEQSVDQVADNQLPQDFLVFYQKFHEDSLFQLGHVQFPLQGIPERDGSQAETDDFRWQKEQWIMHRNFNSMDGAFIQELQPIGDAMVVENIRHQSANYGMQRRFAKGEEGWKLIYYAAMNELAAAE